MKRILLVGESWVSNSTHYKGFDQFQSTTYHLGADNLIKVIDKDVYNIDYLKAHEAAESFPSSLADLKQYSAIIFSDIGSNSILLHPKVWLHGETFPNRLNLVKDYVNDGGSFLMVGGYMSFQGINGVARYKSTVIEEILPVEILPYDDRMEIPEGFNVNIDSQKHQITKRLQGTWPPLLGFNQVKSKKNVNIIIKTPKETGSHPLLIIGDYGKGKTMAWTSDIGPHWVSNEFLNWEGYEILWTEIFDWLTN